MRSEKSLGLFKGDISGPPIHCKRSSQCFLSRVSRPVAGSGGFERQRNWYYLCGGKIIGATFQGHSCGQRKNLWLLFCLFVFLRPKKLAHAGISLVIILLNSLSDMFQVAQFHNDLLNVPFEESSLKEKNLNILCVWVFCLYMYLCTVLYSVLVEDLELQLVVNCHVDSED